MFHSEALSAEWTLRFHSGRSLSDVKPKFFKNDIFVLTHEDKTEELISADTLDYVRREAGSHIAIGIILGALGGGTIGGLIGNATAGEGGGDPNVRPVFATAGGAVLGILVGGVTGGIIGSNIEEDESYDLTAVDLKTKIEIFRKLIR